LCAALALLGTPAAAAPDPAMPERVAPVAGVTVPTTFEPWTLTAATPQEVELHQFHGPCGHLACTEWTIDPTFSFEPAGPVCKLTAISVKVSVNYRLPSWRPARPPAPDMQAFWQEKWREVLRHEARHRDLAVETANRVQAALTALAPAPTCAELIERGKTLAFRLIAEGEQRQRDYDARTAERYRHSGR
jgi:predicted secreted Zn-dependent protease